MPRDLKQELTDAELNARNLIPGTPGALETGISDTQAAIDASRAASNESTANVARETAGKYGLAPDVGAAAVPGVARGNEDLTRANMDALSLRKIRERQDNVNKTFNFLFGRLVSAGEDVQSAKATAMQYALDQDRRAAETASNEQARRSASAKQDILTAYSNQQIQMQRKAESERRQQAILNSMVKTFFGMAGTVGAAYVGGPAAAVPK